MTSGERGRIGARFERRAAEGRPGFVPYVTAGYPSLDHTLDLLLGLAEVGADVVELGIPFSDPMADGPTIQRSCQGALAGGATVAGALRALAELRRRSDVPVVVFSYLNPLIARGPETFLAEAVDAGADGLLPTDLPLGSDPKLEDLFMASPLDLVRLVAPTTDRARVRDIVRSSQGFVYYVARTGVTGARASVRSGLAREVEAVREASSLPVAAGFGVSTARHARIVGAVADAVVVGSALVDRLDEGGVDAALDLARELRSALDEARTGGAERDLTSDARDVRPATDRGGRTRSGLARAQPRPGERGEAS